MVSLAWHKVMGKQVAQLDPKVKKHQHFLKLICHKIVCILALLIITCTQHTETTSFFAMLMMMLSTYSSLSLTSFCAFSSLVNL